MIEKFSGDFLQWLRGFYFAAHFGNISQAAKHMGLIQSAVSHQIKNLEKELNVVLFLRGNREMTLTPEGDLLLRKAIALFERVQDIRDEVGKREGELGGKIRLVTTHALGLHYLPGIIRDFAAKHPKVRFELNGGGFAFIVDMVDSARADMGIVNLYDFPVTIDYTLLFDSGLVLVGPLGNPFGLPERCTLEDVSRLPFLSFPAFGTVETIIKGELRNQGLVLNKVMVANNFALLLKYVEQGLGVTILDRFAVSDHLGRVEVYSLADHLPPRRHGFILRKDQYLPPQVSAFRDMLLESLPPPGCHRVAAAGKGPEGPT